MATRQNTATKTSGKLTAKYSPAFSTFDDNQFEKLQKSLELAQRAVSKMETFLAPGGGDVRSGRSMAANELGFDASSILQYAFRLSSNSNEWRPDLQHIVQFFRRIKQGLSEDITIADAHASTVGTRIDDAITNVTMTMESTFGVNPFPTMREDYLDARDSPFMPKVGLEYHLTAHETGSFLKPAFDAGTDKAKAVHGFVKAKHGVKPVKHGPPIAAKDWGSIHLNFTAVLKNSGVKNGQVAHAIIHEASHKFCSTWDFAYGHVDGAFWAMRKVDALKNADSYGLSAMCIYYRRNFKSGPAISTTKGLDTNV
jgi:hypothetical protein